MRDILYTFFKSIEPQKPEVKQPKNINVDELYDNIVSTFENNEPVKFFHTRKTYDILCSMVRTDRDTMVFKSRQCGLTTLSILYAFEHCIMNLNSNNVFWFIYPTMHITDFYDRKISKWYPGLSKTYAGKYIEYRIGNNRILFINDFKNVNVKDKAIHPTHVIFDEFTFAAHDKRNICLNILANLQVKPKIVEIQTTDNELLYSNDGKYPYMEDFNYTKNNQNIDVFFYNWYETEKGVRNGLKFNRNINGTNVNIQIGRDDVCNMLVKPSGVIKTLTNEGWKMSSEFTENFVKATGDKCLKDKPEFDKLYMKTIFYSMLKSRPNTMKYGYKDNNGTENVKSVELKKDIEDKITYEDMLKILSNVNFWKDILNY